VTIEEVNPMKRLIAIGAILFVGSMVLLGFLWGRASEGGDDEPSDGVDSVDSVESPNGSAPPETTDEFAECVAPFERILDDLNSSDEEYNRAVEGYNACDPDVPLMPLIPPVG
jgi:hypothetical protein